MVVDIINTVILSWRRSLASLSCITFQLDQQSFHQVIILRVSAHYQPINISIFSHNKNSPISISRMSPCLPSYKNRGCLMLVCIDREATWLSFFKALSQSGNCALLSGRLTVMHILIRLILVGSSCCSQLGSFMFGNCCAYTVLYVLKIDSGVFVKIKLNFVSQ